MDSRKGFITEHHKGGPNATCTKVLPSLVFGCKASLVLRIRLCGKWLFWDDISTYLALFTWSNRTLNAWGVLPVGMIPLRACVSIRRGFKAFKVYGITAEIQCLGSLCHTPLWVLDYPEPFWTCLRVAGLFLQIVLSHSSNFISPVGGSECNWLHVEQR